MISIIIPFYNEGGSLPVLIEKLIKICNRLKQKYEVVMVDDGSTDAWRDKLQLPSSSFQIIHHRKRLGKGQALLDGFKQSKGEVIIFMDADFQDDPVDIKKFLKKINEGYDLVNGWRKKRQDPLIKTLPSSIFNFLILKLFFQSKFHDINCGFKAVKRQVLEEIILYGDNYRFLPLMADKRGFKTTEVIVSHRPRKFGQSKFGFFRLLSGFLDTLTTYFIYQFSEKPLHFFGPIGGILFLSGFLITLYLVMARIFYGVLLYRRPALLLGILLIIVGIQIIMTGIIGELIVYLSKKNSNNK